MEYRFFVFKWAGGKEFCRFPFGWPRGPEAVGNWPNSETWEVCAPFDVEAFRAVSDRCEGLQTGVRFAPKSKWQRLEDGVGGGANRLVRLGIIARCHIRHREKILEGLVEVARKLGLSIADPFYGVLLLTAPDADRRAECWMKCRRAQLTEWLLRQGGRQCFALPRTTVEARYVVVDHPHGYGRPVSAQAGRFRAVVRKGLFPGETLEPHRGWVTVKGPDGCYKIQLSWEGNGKHARFTADFREVGCPIIELGRSSVRMARRTESVRSLVAVGMEQPTVMELVPDPAERYMLLYFANRKLEKRLPRALVEELKAAKAKLEENEASPSAGGRAQS